MDTVRVRYERVDRQRQYAVGPTAQTFLPPKGVVSAVEAPRPRAKKLHGKFRTGWEEVVEYTLRYLVESKGQEGLVGQIILPYAALVHAVRSRSSTTWRERVRSRLQKKSRLAFIRRHPPVAYPEKHDITRGKKRLHITTCSAAKSRASNAPGTPGTVQKHCLRFGSYAVRYTARNRFGRRLEKQNLQT